jgi:eukaryotic-like serine/threonine-protein kinase
LDNQSGSLLLLPIAIHKFLSFFDAPIYFDQVIKKYEQLTKKPSKTIRKTVEPFFDSMLYRGIIIPEHERLKTPPTIKLEGVFGAYNITKVISNEGTLKICLAQKEGDDKLVVLKILDNRQIPDRRDQIYWLKRFKQEIAIMKSLQEHPSVCQMVEVFETPHGSALAMEYIEGDSLRHWLGNTQPVSEAQKRAIFKQILEVYAFFQSKNVLHGDIHRSNIMITPQSKVKIIDFDMSYHQPVARGEFVIPGGVHEYLPPEKISPNFFDIVNDAADFTSEAYQLGVIGYYIFYEKLPFYGATWQTLAKVIREDEPVWGLYASQDEKLDSLDAFLAKALCKNPRDRFQSATAMLDNFFI